MARFVLTSGGAQSAEVADCPEQPTMTTTPAVTDLLDDVGNIPYLLRWRANDYAACGRYSTTGELAASDQWVAPKRDAVDNRSRRPGRFGV